MSVIIQFPHNLKTKIRLLISSDYKMAGSGNPYTYLKKSLEVGGETKTFFDLPALGAKYNQLPFSIRVLLESAVRNCDNFQVLEQDVEKVLNWKETQAK